MAAVKAGSSPVRRKQMLLLVGLGIVVVLVALIAAMLGAPPKRSDAPRPEVPIRKQFGAQDGGVTDKEMWRTQEGARVTQLQDEMKDLRDKLKASEEQKKTEASRQTEEQRVRNEQEARRAAQPQPPTVAQSSKLPITPPPSNALPVQRTAGQLGLPGPTGGTAPGFVYGPDGQPMEQVKGIVKIQVSSDASPNGGSSAAKGGGSGSEGRGGDRGDKRHTTENYLPTGSFLRATNLGGIDAPTGGQVQQNPLPVIFRVLDFANLPNRFRADYKECFVTGNGYGDLSAERAYIRLDRLSCVSEDGAAIDVAVKGYVAGEDGKAGMRGRLVSKQGAVLANALLAGVASGIGNAFVQQNSTISTSPLGSTSTVDPNKAVQVGLGQGVGTALNKLATYYVSLAEKMFPIIEIDSGREVDLVITRGISIER